MMKTSAYSKELQDLGKKIKHMEPQDKMKVLLTNIIFHSKAVQLQMCDDEQGWVRKKICQQEEILTNVVQFSRWSRQCFEVYIH